MSRASRSIYTWKHSSGDQHLRKVPAMTALLTIQKQVIGQRK